MIRNKKDIIYYLANKYDMPLKTIEKIVTYQFKFVSNIMTKGNFDSVRLPYFGRFSVNKNRIKYITKLKENGGKTK
tara:strand:- start:1894 stop:2121 length:228 start_codon:yes stop_codon:yes gene_type:complete